MRNIRIDFLRALGLAMIVLAHVNPPAIIMQLRNFDVPLMVLVSGMSFGLSYHQEAYSSYMWKRVKRLVFPVWIFLSMYFGLILLLDLPLEKLTPNRVLGSYFFMDGIGYVWIIKVFLLVALVSPLTYRFHKNTASNEVYFGCIALIFVVYEILRILTKDFFASGPGEFIAPISHYIIPYTLVFAIGLRLASLKVEEIVWGMNLCLALFIVLAFLLAMETGQLIPTQLHKYPPTLYYFSYALTIALAAWLLSGKLCHLIEKSRAAKATMAFAARHSLWIYLWHIPFIKIIPGPYPIRYVLIMMIAFVITFTQIWATHNLLPKVFKRSKSAPIPDQTIA